MMSLTKYHLWQLLKISYTWEFQIDKMDCRGFKNNVFVLFFTLLQEMNPNIRFLDVMWKILMLND